MIFFLNKNTDFCWKIAKIFKSCGCASPVPRGRHIPAPTSSQTLNLSATLDISEIVANNYSYDDFKNFLCIVLAQNKKLSDQLHQQFDE
jgi:hypothetical protein